MVTLLKPASGLRINADAALAEATELDVLLLCGGVNITRAQDSTLLSGLRKAAKRPIKLGALCTASYILAKAGLLEGYRCTIHWENLASMRRRFFRS